MKSLARVLFAVYLVTLAWLVLFKFSIHIASVLHYGHRSLNLVPFSHSSGSSSQSVENVVVFVPFGLLLGVNCKGLPGWRKVLIVLGGSIAAETLQYIFAIGVSDSTDVMTNLLGGLIGLGGYGLGRKFVDERKLDKFFVLAGSILLGLCLLFLVTVEVLHGVRYHRHG